MEDMMEARMRVVEQTISTHEAVCAERYGNINSTLHSIVTILRWFGAVLLVGMAAILVKQVFHT